VANRKRIVRWVLIAAGLGVVVLGAMGVMAYRRAMAEPGYWQIVDTTDEAVARDSGDFEQWITSQFSKQRPSGEPWQIELTEADINKWLATRLPSWAANQAVAIPDWLAHPMVAIENQRIIVACEVNRAGQRLILTLAYRPVTGETGVALKLAGVYLGKQKIASNGEQLLDRLRALGAAGDLDGDEADVLRERIDRVALAGSLGDGRTVRVKKISLSDGGMVLTCVTE